VDAVALSAAKLARGGLEPGTAALAVLVACGSNTGVKTVIAWTIGGAAFGRRLLPAVGVMGLAVAAGVFVAWKLG